MRRRTDPRRARSSLAVALFAALVTLPSRRDAAEPEPPPLVRAINALDGLPGGLCVHVGDQPAAAVALAQSSRFLIQILTDSAAAAERLRRPLRAAGLYGLASVDQRPAGAALPLAENLVNLLVLAPPATPSVPLAEALRVLAPRGWLVADSTQYSESMLQAAGLEAVRAVPAESGGAWTLGRKPWPADMDQ